MRSFLLRFGLLLLASYGLLYFSYKFYDPDLIRNFDYQSQYYDMYQSPLDFGVANAPFVYRQISAIITHTLLEAGVYYPTEIAYHSLIFPMLDQRVFFAALLVNYFALVLTSTVSGSIVERETGGFSFPLLAGFLCMIGFHAQSAVITGTVEGVTFLFFGLLYLLYRCENRTLFAILLGSSILQRETIPVVFGLIGAFGLLVGQGDKRYNQFVLASSILSFVAYFILRVYIIKAPGFEEQFSISVLLNRVVEPTISPRALVFSLLLTQNVLFIATGISLAVWFRTREVPKHLLVLILTLIGLVTVAVVEDVRDSVGRIAAILSPAFAAIAAGALSRYERLSGRAERAPSDNRPM